MSRRKPSTLFMQRTEIPVARTVSDIHNLLIGMGAAQISTIYENGEATGITFLLPVAGRNMHYRLPVRVAALEALLPARRGGTGKDRASRIAWRQIFHWLEAQLALLATGMVEKREILFPYLLDESQGQTLFEAFEADASRLLGPGKTT